MRDSSPGEFELVPMGLPVMEHLGRLPLAGRWLAALPLLIEQVREASGLRLSAPLHGGSCSWVALAELADGTRVIVKIAWPHREMYGKTAALRLWDGRGAVRLLAHDRQRHALILQRCEPGLGEYTAYSNGHRPRRALAQRPPNPTASQQAARPARRSNDGRSSAASSTSSLRRRSPNRLFEPHRRRPPGLLALRMIVATARGPRLPPLAEPPFTAAEFAMMA